MQSGVITASRGALPFTLQVLLARTAANVIPREYLIHRALAGRIKLRIKSAVTERLYPLFKIEALIPATILQPRCPCEQNSPALTAVASCDNAFEHRGLGIVPVIGDVLGLHNHLEMRLLLTEGFQCVPAHSH